MRSQIRRREGNGRVILAVAAGVMFAVFLISACGGGEEDGGGTQGSGTRVSASGVTLSLPDGWAFLDNGERGLVLAELEADLTAVVAQGPRLTVQPGNTDLPDPEALVSAIVGAGGDSATRLEVAEEPETVRVGSEEGVSIGLLEGDGQGTVIKRYVIVSADGVNVHQFVLEAPEGQWDDSADTLTAILESVEFAAS